MANRTIQMSTGIITNWAYNSESYYGFDTGPNLIYGECRSAYFTGKNNKSYKLHACRWGTDNRVYVRFDNSSILSTDSYTSYTTALFDSISIGSTTFNASAVSAGFTLNGGVGLYWNTSTNPVGTTAGTLRNVTFTNVGEGPYGAEFRNSSGKLILSLVDRVERFVQTGLTPFLANNESHFEPVSGMENNDSWNVYAGVNGSPSSLNSDAFDITKSTGGFTITNDSGSPTAVAYDYWVLRT
jgi:hypothetical protein